jgi:hypothetical protein
VRLDVVAALVLSDDEAIRHGTEDALAREISARGGVGVPAYTLLPKDVVQNKGRTRELLEQASVEDVVAIRAVAWEKALLPNLGRTGAARTVARSGGPGSGAGAAPTTATCGSTRF